MSAPVFLLSDFGTRDAFVGVMKAVISGLAPASGIHDLVHDLPPQDLAGARLQLGAALPYLPDRAVLCAVVDPGVGTGRRGIALAAVHGDGRRLVAVAPDNGLLSELLAPPDAAGAGSPPAPAGGWTVTLAIGLDRDRLPPRGPGTTFDGRDLFAPAAGRAAAGAALELLGRPLDPGTLVRARDPVPREEAGVWTGRVVWIDRFGNLVTDLGAAVLPPVPAALRVMVAGRVLHGLSPGFAAVAVHAPAVYLGSLGRVEIGVRDGNAAVALGVRVGDEVRAWAEGAAAG